MIFFLVRVLPAALLVLSVAGHAADNKQNVCTQFIDVKHKTEAILKRPDRNHAHADATYRLEKATPKSEKLEKHCLEEFGNDADFDESQDRA